VVRDSAVLASRATVVVSRVIEAGERIVHSPDESLGGLGYLDLLERSLENLQIDASESEELESLAATLGLGDAQRKQVHMRYLERLIDEVVSDGEVTSDEYEMLVRVAASLGMDQDIVHRRTRPWRRGEAQCELVQGMRLCLTGDAVGISREELSMRLRRAGFVVDPNVTKATQLLVAADPSSQSGKAQSALMYGVPIVAVDHMVSARPGDTVPVAVLTVERLVAHVCTACGVTWTSPSRSPDRGRLCAACRGDASSASRASAQESSEAPDGQESLICSQCGSVWSRVRARGRKPKVCPQCRPVS
jgi:DNA polymerase-3 subunit epsilon